MIRPKDKARAAQLSQQLDSHSQSVRQLHGIASVKAKSVLIEQLLESLHRVEFIAVIQSRAISPQREDPSSSNFDPIRAAILKARRGQTDEAYWMIFLSTHFGRHPEDGWRLARDVYAGDGPAAIWDWASVSADPKKFRAWLDANEARLRAGGVSRRFSNHRKYESLKGAGPNGTGAAVESYVRWIDPLRGHDQMIRDMHMAVGQNPETVFEALFESMSCVKRFGRLGKFDYLTMLGKLGLAPISPGRTFLAGATGPLAGARLLYGAQVAAASPKDIEKWLVELDQSLGVGAQPLEDALCNWQKSPDKFRPFR